jgi:uncharacterized membrane protein
MSVAFAVLLWLHVFGAIGWLGAVMVFGMLIGPILPTLTPASRGELTVKLFPKYIRYSQIFTLITPIFGVGLALQLGNGSFSVFSPNTNLGLFISIGALLSIVAWVIVFAVLSPTARKIVRLTQEMMKNPGPPQPELLGASKRLRMTAATGLVSAPPGSACYPRFQLSIFGLAGLSFDVSGR